MCFFIYLGNLYQNTMSITLRILVLLSIILKKSMVAKFINFQIDETMQSIGL